MCLFLTIKALKKGHRKEKKILQTVLETVFFMFCQVFLSTQVKR